MAVQPTTNLKLLKCPLTLDNKNQITFTNINSQYSYFNNLPSLEIDNISYQRKDSIIRYPAHIDTLLEYNYCMYQNENYGNKWFFSFITDMRYVNDNNTEITIKTDVFQTWQFDIIYKNSFVEREHVNDDTIGNNVIPENLDLGEFICNKKAQWLNISTSSLVILIGVTELPDGTHQSGVLADGIYQGLRYYAYSYNDVSLLNTLLYDYAHAGKSEAIKCMFVLPSALTGGAETREDHLYSGSNTPLTNYINNGEASTINKIIDFSNTTVDGYSPKNNKVKVYPYTYLLVSNNSGTDVIYRYEDFYTISNNEKELTTPSFKIESSITPSGSIRMIPRNYKGTTENDIEGINMGKFPICNWDTDVFINWLTQNGVNIPLSLASSAVGITASALTGNPIGIASGVIGIASTLGEIYKESLIPPQSEGNINAGDVITASGNNDFHFYSMSIKNNQAKIIDDFFSMFGYKVNSVKLPNITGRLNWNYVKTIDINLQGNLPQEDLIEIKNIFNEGVTLWHNTNTFLDYSQTNNII